MTDKKITTHQHWLLRNDSFAYQHAEYKLMTWYKYKNVF